MGESQPPDPYSNCDGDCYLCPSDRCRRNPVSSTPSPPEPETRAETLRRVARQARADRDLRTAMELEAIADKAETPSPPERCETCNDTGRIPADHSEGAAGLPCPDCTPPEVEEHVWIWRDREADPARLVTDVNTVAVTPEPRKFVPESRLTAALQEIEELKRERDAFDDEAERLGVIAEERRLDLEAAERRLATPTVMKAKLEAAEARIEELLRDFAAQNRDIDAAEAREQQLRRAAERERGMLFDLLEPSMNTHLTEAQRIAIAVDLLRKPLTSGEDDTTQKGGT